MNDVVHVAQMPWGYHLQHKIKKSNKEKINLTVTPSNEKITKQNKSRHCQWLHTSLC